MVRIGTRHRLGRVSGHCSVHSLTLEEIRMLLLWLILIPLAAGILSWIVARWSTLAPRWISLAALLANLVVTAGFWLTRSAQTSPGPWLLELNLDWISQFGIRFQLALDGLSLVLLLLTFFLGVMAVLTSWTEIREKVGFFHFNLMWVLAGVTGVFLAVDLFLFYLFWELMLVPMYFLIAIWGHERRVYASVKFFLFTQLSGLLMLASILGLAILHQRSTGVWSFGYEALRDMTINPSTARWLMLGFAVAFAVKLPAFPVHSWLPDAHTEAPTAGSLILAGLLLKTGAYGFIRFVVPLFPGTARDFAPLFMTLGVAGILYGALLAMGQSDLKRLVAYTSVSHMGFVLLGVFSGNNIALQGSVIQMVSHGISTGALFIIAGALQERMHTRDLGRMGGLWDVAPRLSGAGLAFVMASVGLPGLGDFIGEFLVLVGAYQVSVPLTCAAALGVIASALYGLRLVKAAFYGPNANQWQLPDLRVREWFIFAPMFACLVWIGLYPQPLLRTFQPVINGIAQVAATTLAAGR
jgi:NADH-quinone oxidoreductase subunit M